MIRPFTRFCLSAILSAATLAGVGPAGADPEGLPVPVAQRQADPCTFYRMRARGLGLDHWAAEVVWACEAVARHRAAGMTMSGRMLAVEAALERYREALVLDRRDRLASAAPRGRAHRAAMQEAEARLAEETGMLLALEAIRQGF